MAMPTLVIAARTLTPASLGDRVEWLRVAGRDRHRRRTDFFERQITVFNPLRITSSHRPNARTKGHTDPLLELQLVIASSSHDSVIDCHKSHLVVRVLDCVDRQRSGHPIHHLSEMNI